MREAVPVAVTPVNSAALATWPHSILVDARLPVRLAAATIDSDDNERTRPTLSAGDRDYNFALPTLHP